jgi:hypothetical protein
MKSALSLAVSCFLLVGAFAEDASIETEKSAADVAAERQKKILAEQERAKALLEKKTVTYSGFIHEARQAENKKKFFSLRQPHDPLNDARNISYDERTAKPRGFVLFRIGF